MIHITEITWVQLLLIETGAMLQVAAVGFFMRDSAKPDHIVRGAREVEIAHDEMAKCKLPELHETHAPAKVVQYQRKIEGVMEDVPADIRPGDLLKTAKVNFKQSLKPSTGERPFVPNARW